MLFVLSLLFSQGSKLTPKGRECPNRAFLILGRLPKLDNRPDSCEILHNRVLPRVLANKTIFIKNTQIVGLLCHFLKMQFYSDSAAED